jgi:hypothetical protein
MVGKSIYKLRHRSTHHLWVSELIRRAVEEVERVDELEVLVEAVEEGGEFDCSGGEEGLGGGMGFELFQQEDLQKVK